MASLVHVLNVKGSSGPIVVIVRPAYLILYFALGRRVCVVFERRDFVVFC